MQSPVIELIKRGKISLELFCLVSWVVIANQIQNWYVNISLIFAFIWLPFMARLYQSGEFELVGNPPKTITGLFKKIGQIVGKTKFFVSGAINNLFFTWTMIYLVKLTYTNWTNAEYAVLKALVLVGISAITYYFIAPWILQRDRVLQSVKEVTKNRKS